MLGSSGKYRVFTFLEWNSVNRLENPNYPLFVLQKILLEIELYPQTEERVCSENKVFGCGLSLSRLLGYDLLG